MKIFVISLIDAKERRETIANIMQKLNLDFEFFDAVDCRGGLPEKYHSMIDRQKAISKQGFDLSNAEYGCALSHAMVYGIIVKQKIEHTIILEDDAIVDKDFLELIQGRYLQNSNAKGVFLYHLFASAVMPFAKPFFAQYKLHRLAKTPLSTAGYYVTYDFAKTLFGHSVPICTQADWPCDVANMGMQAIVPRIVRHPAIENSVIEKNRTAKKILFGKYGFVAWLKYKIIKLFSNKISKTIEGK